MTDQARVAITRALMLLTELVEDDNRRVRVERRKFADRKRRAAITGRWDAA